MFTPAAKARVKKGIKGHKEGSQKRQATSTLLHWWTSATSKKYEYILANVTGTISSVDIRTSASRRMFARAISSVENSSEAADVNGEKHSQPIHHRGAVHKHHRGNGWCRNKGNYRSLLRKRKRTSIMCVANLHSLPWNKIRTTLKAKMNLRACIGKPLPSRCSSSSGGSSNLESVHPRTQSNYRKGQNPSRRQN